MNASGAETPATETSGTDTSSLPALSVVVANYNQAHYLPGTLEELENQSIRPLEVIVVDDASTDNSRAVVEDFAAGHPYVRLVRQAENLGVNATFNRGLEEAKGDYVYFFSADDHVTSDFTESYLSFLAEHPQAAFCFSNPAEIPGEDGEQRDFSLFIATAPRAFSGSEMAQLLSRSFFTFTSNSVVYRRHALMETGGHPEALDWQADWFVNHVLAFRHGACYLPGVYCPTRVRGESFSARGLADAQEQKTRVLRALDMLRQDEYADVAPAFREAGVLPEMSLRALTWAARIENPQPAALAYFERHRPRSADQARLKLAGLALQR
ncbi:MAG: glycosyltransferase family A protein, partial [Kiritimatiellia bacterium]|nr:glycosyltransferase family A protein [Kiritimatiellia bacterium]